MRDYRAELIERLAQGETVKYLFFWGHTPYDPPRATCLSQWYVSPFEVDGIQYPTAEHWMMAGKARLFQDAEHLEQILAAEHPAAAKKLGRQVRGFDSEVWDAHRFDLVVEGNRHKFAQNDALADYLRQSGQRVLVEASPVDPIWGIGLAQDDPRAHDPAQWQGHNLLGFALMEVRDGLMG